MKKMSPSYTVFYVFNTVLLTVLALLCFLPILNILSLSLSDNIAVQQGKVLFWPVNFTSVGYQYIISNTAFWRAMWVSVMRVALGFSVNITMTILVAYPLSKSSQVFPARTRYVWFFLVTILFSGGLIPTFLVVKNTGLIGSMFALVIPGAVPIFNVVLLLNFFRQLPKELEEAAFIDGAGHITTLINIILPVSKAALATISLFMIVAHWNEWFTPIIYMKRTEDYPLQTYLRSTIISARFNVNDLSDMKILNKLSNKTVISAQIFIAMIPILCVYPFLQKHFAQGIVLGSVKG
ncbi:MAG: carbohydrate ABC transporter permease [Oscillospiraceae bacterium]|nr:carbohydrate ABC transporter permease [Oscillospiraceae bacterium]